MQWFSQKMQTTVITIHLKLNGYAPKYSIACLRKINTWEKQKASHSKNDLLNGGGEGGI